MARDLDITIRVDDGDAVAKLTTLDGTVDQTGKRFEQFGANLTQAEASFAKHATSAGVVTNQQRLLGTAIQTTSEATSLSTGVMSTFTQVLGGIGVAFGIEAVMRFGREVLADADALEKMHDRTGLSVGALQELQRVGADSGNTIEQFAGAINILQRNLGNGDAGAVEAVKRLGLNFETLKAMSPEDQFFTIAKALQGVSDQNENVSTGTKLMGRQYGDILPSIKQGFGEVSHEMETAIKALDTMGDAIGHIGRAIKEAALSTLGGLFERELRNAQSLSAAISFLTAGYVGNGAEADALARAHANLATAIPRVAAATKDLSLTATEQASIERDLGQQLKVIETATKETATADAAWAKVMAELNTTGASFKDTLAELDGETINAVEYYLKAGVAQATLAKAYGLTDVQVKALADDTVYLDKVATESAVAAQESIAAIIEKMNDEAAAAATLQQGYFNDAVASDKANAALGSYNGSLERGARMASDAAQAFTGLSVSIAATNDQMVAFWDDVAQHNSAGGNAQNNIGTPVIFSNTPQVNAGTRFQHRAAGGPVEAGTPYLVGERGPEMFVPAHHGAIVPNGGGVSFGNIVVNGNVDSLATVKRLATQVTDEVMRRQRGSQRITWSKA